MAYCSKCGAALQPGATKCEYCGSLVEVRQAPADAYRPFAVGGDRPKFKASSVVMMLLLSCFTLGLYGSIWYLMRREGLRQLDKSAANKTNAVIGGYVGCQCLWYALAYVGEPGSEVSSLSGLMGLLFFGVGVYAAFYVRGLLRGYALRLSPQSPVSAFVAPSEVLTFFLGIYYLQVHINRMIGTHMLDMKV